MHKLRDDPESHKVAVNISKTGHSFNFTSEHLTSRNF